MPRRSRLPCELGQLTIELNAASVGISHHVHQLGADITLAGVERVEGRSGQPLKRRLIFVAQRVEKGADSALDVRLCPRRTYARGLI